MRTYGTLSVFATIVIAKESLPINYGVSRPVELLGASVGSWCLNDNNYLLGHSIGQTEKAQAAALWAHSAPCAVNGTKEYCVYSDPDYAGRGISILTSPDRAIEIAKKQILERSERPRRTDQANARESSRWRVEEVPGKGMGLIATQNIQMGDHIMSTTASVMIDYNVFYDATSQEVMDMEVAAVDYLPDTHRKLFLNLSTHDGADDYEAQVSKVILTNSFDIPSHGFIISAEESQDDNFYTVFPEISRMNHDCRPNADYYFDPETLAQHIHAVRPIAAGEEITISYIDTIQTRKDRLGRLDHSWHFPCSCSSCTQNEHMTAASDARIRQIQEIRRQLRNWEPDSQATTAMAELLVSLYHQERLWTMLYEAYTYAAIEYNGDGEPWLAIKYAGLAVQHGLASGGPGDPDVKEMMTLLQNPWEHWSWMLRTRKRMNQAPQVAE